jgi:hypothetical protein
MDLPTLMPMILTRKVPVTAIQESQRDCPQSTYDVREGFNIAKKWIILARLPADAPPNAIDLVGEIKKYYAQPRFGRVDKLDRPDLDRAMDKIQTDITELLKYVRHGYTHTWEPEEAAKKESGEEVKS